MGFKSFDLFDLGTAVGVFFNIALVEVDPCDTTWGPLLYGGHRCDPNTTLCVPFHLGHGLGGLGLRRMSYRCQCRYGYGPVNPPGGSPPLNDTYTEPPHFTCSPCPKDQPRCGMSNTWQAGVRTGLKVAQGVIMATVLLLGLVVFKKRKCKVVASSMWMMLETLLLGALLMQTAVVLRFVEPSLWMCLLEPWCREMGFVVCYGSIILKLYRILVEFRTRKAHRWVLKDRDLLRHLGAMVLAVFAYLAALTAASLHFYNEGFQLLDTVTTDDGMVYPHCKVFWWDWVTQAAELVSLFVGIHLAWVSRSFRTQFNERAFLCAALFVELIASTALYVGQAVRVATRTANLSPTTVLVFYFIREQMSVTIVLGLVFIPVLWLARRQPAARSLLPTLDNLGKPADGSSSGAGTGFHSSDVDVTEVTLKDMNPDDIRKWRHFVTATLLLFLLLEGGCRRDPGGGRVEGGLPVPVTDSRGLLIANLRTVSVRTPQKRGSREKALHHRHMRSSARHHTDVEVTEAEGSRTPEDSVCSQEGPSAVFNDGPSTYSEYGYGTPSVSYKGSSSYK
ncbi:probable G-protein coupled receptor 158 [Frankliniella occidentalis]|uniref:Probable G-protein coupled receptor 158 n=1 Tax=Frankliniella occidentalis TaxID=133901 RepID=A0A9C6WQR6_FRAOC|nr:probable G-protein coupled receptor 158 [Frankliniella occidentalis]